MKRSIRNSAKALIIRNDQVLAIRIRDENEEWYVLPGGGQDAEELLPEAVCREVLEETGLRVAVQDLAFVIEGRRGEPFHRVDLVFRCELLSEEASIPLHADTWQAGMEWLDIASLNQAALYPSRLRRAIMNLHEGKPYAHYLGNEEIGDPEITD